jgi:phosphinothricin acetyltransferase
MRLPKIDLRPAERCDSEQIAAIYAPIVRDTFVSFETEPPSAEVMAGRVESIQRQHPWLVATAEDEVLGPVHK